MRLQSCIRFYPYETSVSQVISVLQNGSLFASRRVVVYSDVHAAKDSDYKLISGYLKQPNAEAVLVMTTDISPGTREYPRRLADMLPKDAVQIFWEMFDTDKRGWVMRYFREHGMELDKDAVDLLLDISEGTTDALKDACARLCFNCKNNSVLHATDVEQFLEHSRMETVYSLFDRFCRRDLNGTLEIFWKLLHSDPGTADRLAAVLADQLSRLTDFKQLLSKGLSDEQAAADLKIRGGKRALASYSSGVRHYTLNELNNALRQLVDLEAWNRTSPQELRVPKTELWLCQVMCQTVDTNTEKN